MMSEDHERETAGPSRGVELRDPATGLAAEALLEERTNQALKHAQRKRLTFAVAVFCVDRFEAIASSLDASAAGELLQELGRRLSVTGRAEDTIAYLGDGTFAALLPGAAGPAEAGAAVGAVLAATRDAL